AECETDRGRQRAGAWRAEELHGPNSTVEPAALSMQFRSDYLRTPASRLPTPAPPDFVTNCVSTGTALLTSSGFNPSFENALAALASPAMPARPDVPATFESGLPPPIGGAAFSRPSIPGTAFETCENSSGFSRLFARPKSEPAAPSACAGVEPS